MNPINSINSLNDSSSIENPVSRIQHPVSRIQHREQSNPSVLSRFVQIVDIILQLMYFTGKRFKLDFYQIT